MSSLWFFHNLGAQVLIMDYDLRVTVNIVFTSKTYNSSAKVWVALVELCCLLAAHIMAFSTNVLLDQLNS